MIGRQKEWYDEIIAYKLTNSLLEDKMEAKKIKREATWFCRFQGQLYMKGLSLPLLRCLTVEFLVLSFE